MHIPFSIDERKLATSLIISKFCWIFSWVQRFVIIAHLLTTLNYSYTTVYALIKNPTSNTDKGLYSANLKMQSVQTIVRDICAP